MAVTTSAVIGIGSGIATSIQGFTSASKARTAQQNADNEAKRMMLNARKRAEQNEYGELSLPLEAFEAEFEANLAADRQAIEALQEGDSRALAAGVGRVGAQQNQEAQATRMNMADEMFGLEKMKADAREQQKQQLIAMDVGEAKMQDQKAREAAEARRMGIEAGFQGIGQVAQGVGDMAPLYGRSMNDKRAQRMMNDQGMKTRAMMAGIDVNDELALFDWISSQEITGKQARNMTAGDPNSSSLLNELSIFGNQ
jgi:hypothetical protein